MHLNPLRGSIAISAVIVALKSMQKRQNTEHIILCLGTLDTKPESKESAIYGCLKKHSGSRSIKTCRNGKSSNFETSGLTVHDIKQGSKNDG